MCPDPEGNLKIDGQRRMVCVWPPPELLVFRSHGWRYIGRNRIENQPARAVAMLFGNLVKETTRRLVLEVPVMDRMLFDSDIMESTNAIPQFDCDK